MSGAPAGEAKSGQEVKATPKKRGRTKKNSTKADA